MDRHVQQADAWSWSLFVFCRRLLFRLLPAHAPNPEANDFVAAQSAEKPGESERAHQRQRVIAPSIIQLNEILFLQLQPRP